MVPPTPQAAASPSQLRLRLLLLVLLAVLPALLLVGISAIRNRNTLAEQVEENALRVARLSAAGHEAAIEGARQFLTALARVPEVRSGSASRCEALVRDLLVQFPDYLNFGLADLPDGELTCSAVPARSTVTVKDRAYFQRAVQTGGFAVGDFLIGRVTGQPALTFGIPVLDDRGGPRAIAFAAISLQVFEDVATKAALPEGSSVVVVDGKGTVLARVPDPLGLVGKTLPEEALVKAVLARPQGTVEVASFDGVRRLYGFTRLQGGGDVSVAVGISSAAAFADVDRTFWFGVTGLALVGILAMIAAWFFGRAFVVRPVTSALRGERQAVERLEQVDQMRTDFVSMVSHELRNPLATVRGFGQLLRDRPESLPDEQRHQAYEVIVRQVDRMASLIDNVLDVSRLESDTFSYAFVAYEPARLLDESAEEARGAWRQHQLVVDSPDGLPTAKGDSDRLKQVLLNLVSNACRYSAEGTTVTLRARSVGTNVRIDVVDEGPGIPAESLALLFHRFARLRTPDAQNVRGTGLGLYISRRIVEAHGGHITVESEPGRGSTFSVEVPIDPPQPGT
ncbi:MAG: sensor histidine kinase [Actinomycetota bacterium]